MQQSLKTGVVVALLIALSSIPLFVTAQQDGLHYEEFDVRIEIVDGVAVTSLLQTINNPANTSRVATFSVRIGSEAFISAFSLHVGATTYVAEVM